MKKTEKAFNYFKNRFNCSQAVFTAFSGDFGISEDSSLKIACAFGAGMGRQQYTCGAVTGALMALGLKYGKAIGDDESKKKETYAKTNEFFNEFIKMHGSISCKVLLNGLNMNNPVDAKKIETDRLFETSCKKYVEDAVLIVEKLMNTPEIN